MFSLFKVCCSLRSIRAGHSAEKNNNKQNKKTNKQKTKKKKKKNGNHLKPMNLIFLESYGKSITREENVQFVE